MHDMGGRLGMKICINTLCGDNNYGNRLQHFALDHLLHGIGMTTTSWTDCTIQASSSSNIKAILKQNIKKLLPSDAYSITHDIYRRIRYGKKVKPNFFRERAFRRFTKRCIPGCHNIYAKTYHDVDGIIQEEGIDYFVAGSDQVWNPEWDRNGYYFLTFAEPKKRLSFSASFGVSEIPECDKERFSKYLNEMKYISVREQRGVEIVRELTGREADLTLDPTLLLERKDWDKYVDTVSVDLPEAYIATYFLGEAPKAVYEYAKRKGLPLVELNSLKNSKYYSIDPLQFVYVIRNAKCVLTDSFHGTAFSLKYNKEFYVFKRQGFKQDMFSRIETLTNLFGLEKRIQNNDRIEEDSEIPAEKWNEINQELTRQRELSMGRLLKAIGEE